MKILTKRLVVGDYSFDIATDKDIVVKAFEEYPEVAEYVFDNKKQIEDSSESSIIKAIKEKNLKNMLDDVDKINTQLNEMVLFVFPDMYKKANGEELDKNLFDEFLKFVEDNDAMDSFTSIVGEFLMQGFSQKEKSKVKIVLK